MKQIIVAKTNKLNTVYYSEQEKWYRDKSKAKIYENWNSAFYDWCKITNGGKKLPYPLIRIIIANKD